MAPIEPISVPKTSSGRGRYDLGQLAREGGLASGRARRSAPATIRSLEGIQAVLQRVQRGVFSGRLSEPRAELLLKATSVALEVLQTAERRELARKDALIEELTLELRRVRGAA